MLENNKQGLYEKGVQYGSVILLFLNILSISTEVIASLTLYGQTANTSRLFKNNSYFLHIFEKQI